MFALYEWLHNSDHEFLNFKVLDKLFPNLEFIKINVNVCQTILECVENYLKIKRNKSKLKGIVLCFNSESKLGKQDAVNQYKSKFMQIQFNFQASTISNEIFIERIEIPNTTELDAQKTLTNTKLITDDDVDQEMYMETGIKMKYDSTKRNILYCALGFIALIIAAVCGYIFSRHVDRSSDQNPHFNVDAIDCIISEEANCVS
eukprot:355652_1